MNILQSLRDSVNQARVELKFAKETNERKELVEQELHRKNQILSALASYKSNYKNLLVYCKIRAAKHESDYISTITEQVDNVLDLIFPEEHYRAKFDRDVLRGEEVCELLIGVEGMRDEDYLPPAEINGGFAKELVGSAAIIAINLLKNSDNMWFDEATSSGDSTSLSNLKPVFDELRRRGIQVIAIEHKQEYYTSVSRKEFYFEKDRANGRITLVDCKVVDEDEVESVGVERPEVEVGAEC